MPLVIGAAVGCLMALPIDASIQVEEVGGLHRSRIGSLDLPAGLKAGEWRWLTPQDLASISA